MERMETEAIVNLHSKVLSIMNIWKKLLAPYNREEYNITTHDEITGEKISVADLISNLTQRVNELEREVEVLKEESKEADNLFYELMNSLDAIDRRIDIVAENPWKEQFE